MTSHNTYTNDQAEALDLGRHNLNEGNTDEGQHSTSPRPFVRLYVAAYSLPLYNLLSGIPQEEVETTVSDVATTAAVPFVLASVVHCSVGCLSRALTRQDSEQRQEQ